MLCLVALEGCGPKAPVISDLRLIPNPNRRVPLAALCDLATDRPTVATLIIDDGEQEAATEAQGGFATRHELVVLGLRPGTTHTVRVLVRDEDGAETLSEPREITTAPLPEDFPPHRASH